MLKFHSEQGEISVSSAVFSNITGMAATNCFGVKGMAYREVRYVVNKNTGAEVRAVDVFVDSMIL